MVEYLKLNLMTTQWASKQMKQVHVKYTQKINVATTFSHLKKKKAVVIDSKRMLTNQMAQMFPKIGWLKNRWIITEGQRWATCLWSVDKKRLIYDTCPVSDLQNTLLYQKKKIWITYQRWEIAQKNWRWCLDRLSWSRRNWKIRGDIFHWILSKISGFAEML